MRRFFSPAIALLNRLGYTSKFTLLWVVSLIAIAVVGHSLYAGLERITQPSLRQLQGIALIEPIPRAVQAMQLHRGLSAALLSGDESMRGRLASHERIVAATIRTLDETMPPDMASSKDYRLFKTGWELLRKDGTQWTISKNFAAHTRLIEQMMLFEVSFADEFLLTMDAEVASHYLMDIAIIDLPNVIEHLGQLRAFGATILSRKQINTADEIRLKVMIGGLDHKLKSLGVHLDKAGSHNPALQGSLSALRDGINSSARQITDFMTMDMLYGRLFQPPAVFLNMATDAIDESYAQIYRSLFPTVRTLIEERIARAEKTLFLTIAAAILLFLMAVYISVSMYYAIIGSIQSLASSARAFANGNLKMRIRLDTRDELSQVGDSFNEMADGFNAMIETHREDEDRLRATIETAMDAVVQMDAQGIITGWNSQAENIFGWKREEAVGRMLGETIIPPQYREAHHSGLTHFLASGEEKIFNSRQELLGLHRDGREFTVELSVTAIRIAGKYEFNGFIRDITQQKKSEQLIWSQANFDTLTGLPNRHMFHDRLEQDIKKAHRAALKTALFFIDLDKFKEVNDTLGHSMGDILLKEAARRIGSCVRETDTVARLGGDEFTVILAELDDTGSVERIAENILQTLAKPFRLENETAYVSASIGITLYPIDATDTEELLRNADQAMYAAKNGGRNRFSYFTHSMQEAAQKRMRLIKELRGALAEGQFKIYYQPIVDMATGSIGKAEALLRWQHPELGMISPMQFIQLSEETGLISGIGDWVFKKSSLQVKRWRSLYNADFQISVNVSPAQFRNAGNLYKTWSDYLREMGLPGQSMVIEITEGLLLDAGSGEDDKLLEFSDDGIQVAIDDFGTGYSSLSYLKKFDIDYLKIDQSFVRDMVTDADDMAVTEAIIVMAHKLGLKVIAEGVETEEQRKLLSEAGCDYAQGYLFSKPVTADELERLLEKQQPENCNYVI